VSAPLTAHMSNFDPIPRLQQIAATIEDGGHLDSPATAAHYINCAIKEIEQLRKERDEARRMCCEQAAMDESGYVKHGDMLHFTESRGWDCFNQEDGK